MRDLAVEVRRALEAAGEVVRFPHPASASELPMLTLRESGLRCHRRASGSEWLTECEYTIDLYAEGAAENRARAAGIDGALSVLGLERMYSAELYDAESGAAHRVLVYRGVLGADGIVYRG